MKCDPLFLLLSTADYGRTVPPFDLINPQNISIFGVAALQYAILKSSVGVREPAKNEQFTRYLDKNIAPLAREAEGIQDDCFSVPEEQRNLEEVKLSLFRLICEMSAFQTELIYKIANTLIISGIKPMGALPVDSVEIDRLFIKYTDLPAYEYFMILFGLWSSAGETATFDSTTLMGKSCDPEKLSVKARNVLLELSKQLSDFSGTGPDIRLSTYSDTRTPLSH